MDELVGWEQELLALESQIAGMQARIEGARVEPGAPESPTAWRS
jgi:hypothetical protein